MKKYNKFKKSIIAFTGIIYTIISVFSCNFFSNANALPVLDTSSWTVLDGGAMQDYYDFGMSPEFLVFGIDKAIENINLKLYNQYGWDLETVSWDIESYNEQISAEQDSMVLKLSNNVYQSYQDALADGYALFNYQLPFFVNNTFNQGKQVILGKLDVVHNTITDVFNNSIVPITTTFFDSLQGIANDMITDNEVKDLSETNVIYSSSFDGRYQDQYGTTYLVHIELDRPVFFYNYGSANYGSIIVGGLTFGVSNPQIVSGYEVNTSNGNTLIMRDNRNAIPTFYTINTDPKYGYGQFRFDFVGSSKTGLLLTMDTLPSFNDTVTFFNDFNNLSYLYSFQNNQMLKEILDELKNHYVTTNDLKEIKDLLHTIPIAPTFTPNPAPNGSPLPQAVPTPPSDFWDLLQDKIDSILADSIEYEPVLPPLQETNPNPDPDPNPNPNPDPDPDEPENPLPDTPPELPEYIFPPMFTDIFDIQGLDIFKPIFDIVGLNYSMYNLWIIIPAILIFVLIVYIIISIF